MDEFTGLPYGNTVKGYLEDHGWPPYDCIPTIHPIVDDDFVDRTPTLLTILCLCTVHSSICQDHLQPGNGPGQNNAGIPAEGPAPWNTPPILLSHTDSTTTQACLAWYWTFCCHGYQVIVISDLRCWWNWSCYSHRKSLLQHYHRVKFKNLEQ